MATRHVWKAGSGSGRNAVVALPNAERRSERGSVGTGQTVTETDAIRLAQMMEMDGDVHTVLRRQHVTTHVREDLTDSERVARKSGVRRVTTRSVKQTTTITRGESQAVTENVAHVGYSSYASDRDASRHEEQMSIPAIAYKSRPEFDVKVRQYPVVYEPRTPSESTVWSEKASRRLPPDFDVKIHQYPPVYASRSPSESTMLSQSERAESIRRLPPDFDVKIRQYPPVYESRAPSESTMWSEQSESQPVAPQRAHKRAKVSSSSRA